MLILFSFSTKGQCPTDLGFSIQQSPDLESGGYTATVNIVNGGSSYDLQGWSLKIDYSGDGIIIHPNTLTSSSFTGSMIQDNAGEITVNYVHDSGESLTSEALLKLTFTGDAGATVDFVFSEASFRWDEATCTVSSSNLTDLEDFEMEDVDISGWVRREFGTCEGLNDGGVAADIDITEDFFRNGGVISESTSGSPSGAYENNVNRSGTYEIRPSRDTDPLCGVTTFDIILIRSHLLNRIPFDTYFELWAADVNGSGSISTIDIILLRRVLLGIDTEFPLPSWVFIPEAFHTTLPQPIDGNEAFPYDETIEVVDVDANLSGQNFYGIKVGDVNNTCTNCGTSTTTNIADPDDGDFTIIANVPLASQGDTIIVNVTPKDSMQAILFNAQLSFNSTYLELIEVLQGDYDGADIEFLGHDKSGDAIINWISMDTLGEWVHPDSTLGKVKLKVLNDITSANGMVSMAGTQNTIIDTVTTDTAGFYEVKLPGAGRPVFIPSNNHHSGFKLSPNPGRGDIQIDFCSEYPGSAVLEIYDLNGRRIYVDNLDTIKGNNRWEINIDNNPDGIYLVKLNVSDKIYTQKISIY